jgi:hypothetical protein
VIPHFDSSKFGQVTINGKIYRDVLVIGELVKERDDDRLIAEVGGHHRLGNFEVEELTANNPELVIIGNGTNGDVEVGEAPREEFKKKGIELKILKTPAAILEFNKMVSQGKKVNALIHTTC